MSGRLPLACPNVSNIGLLHYIGWKCCKPRVLTFDEFLSIVPCTTGKHSTVDYAPNPDNTFPSGISEHKPFPSKPTAVDGEALNVPAPRMSQPVPPAAQPAVPTESDSDDPSIPVPPNTTCRRRGCDAIALFESPLLRDEEECVFHPGQALFHEGSKGWTCCKRRVLEFEEFMKIEGCKRKKSHLFVGTKKQLAQEEALSEVRYFGTLSCKNVSRTSGV